MNSRRAGDEPLGTFRYLLFDVARTGWHERFDQTFFSEIDVDDGQEHPPSQKPPREIDVVKIGDDYEIAFDASQTPELRDWVRETLQPICIEWYPKIVDMLPSDGYAAPRRFTITFEPDMRGVAYTSGRQVVCAEPWFRDNLDGEAAEGLADIFESVIAPGLVDQAGTGDRAGIDHGIEGMVLGVEADRVEGVARGLDADGAFDAGGAERVQCQCENERF